MSMTTLGLVAILLALLGAYVVACHERHEPAIRGFGIAYIAVLVFAGAWGNGWIDLPVKPAEPQVIWHPV